MNYESTSKIIEDVGSNHYSAASQISEQVRLFQDKTETGLPELKGRSKQTFIQTDEEINNYYELVFHKHL